MIDEYKMALRISLWLGAQCLQILFLVETRILHTLSEIFSLHATDSSRTVVTNREKFIFLHEDIYCE